MSRDARMSSSQSERPTHKLYYVGIYARLSRLQSRAGSEVFHRAQESRDYQGVEDSTSIENQISMLTKFISMMPGWIETRTYIDENVSGVNFNRQGFSDMMEDIRAGAINLVLVKDLSRFGRNYLEVGRYLEEELPGHGCRFVALSDGIDTETGENDIMPFLNAINDFYIRDVSKRIRSVARAKAKDGQRLSGTPPYGYDINPNERSRLVVDEYAAGVVREMFSLRAMGMGYAKIAGELNKKVILPPRLYYFQKRGRETKAVTTRTWTIRTVKLMLNNEVYIGNAVSLKRGTRSHRDGREYKRDESEWIRVENAHPPIINFEIWDKVQKLNQTARDNATYANAPQPRLFSGLVVCPDCKTKMGYAIHKETKKDGRVADFGGYICRTYSRSGQTACSSHRILERTLKTLVLGHIQETADKLTLDENKMLDTLKKRLVSDYKANKANFALQRKALEQQLYALENQIDQLYEDKVSGAISAETFASLVGSIEGRRAEAKSKLGSLKQTGVDMGLDDIAKWVALIKEKSTAIEVDRELLVSLIDKIEIGERVVVEGELTQDVQIFYK